MILSKSPASSVSDAADGAGEVCGNEEGESGYARSRRLEARDSSVRGFGGADGTTGVGSIETAGGLTISAAGDWAT